MHSLERGCPYGTVPYTIKRGDTLYELAEEYNTSVEILMRLNLGIDPDNLQIGTTICVPTNIGICPGMQHTIKAGDTLYKLGQQYGVRVVDIIRMNPFVDVYNLRIGTTLCIPVLDGEIAEMIRQRLVNDRMLQREQRVPGRDLRRPVVPTVPTEEENYFNWEAFDEMFVDPESMMDWEQFPDEEVIGRRFLEDDELMIPHPVGEDWMLDRPFLEDDDAMMERDLMDEEDIRINRRVTPPNGRGEQDPFDIMEECPTGQTLYIVREGEALNDLLERWDITYEVLKASNMEVDLLNLTPGTRLCIPEIIGFENSTAGVEYIIQRGDSIQSIARKYKVSAEELIAANPKITTRQFKQGTRIALPERVREVFKRN